MKWLINAPFNFIRLIVQSMLLAFSQIWVNKTRSILTTFGIIIGVASVSAVIAAMDGMNNKVMENFENFGTNKIFIWVDRPKTGPKKNMHHWQLRFKSEQFEGLLENCPSVETIALSTRGGTFSARHEDNTEEGVRVTGVQNSWFDIEKRTISMGRPFTMLDETQARKVCIITEKLRDKLGMDRECTGHTTILFDHHAFLVIGIVDEKPSMIFGDMGGDQHEVFIPFKTAERMRNRSWIHVLAACKSADVAEDAKAEIRFYLRRTRKLKPGEPDTFGIHLMESEVKQVQKVMSMLSLVAFGIVSISLLVGGVGIMNIMLVSVSERTREIGLRKAVGAKPSAILTQFLVEAIVLCLIGGLIGIGFGNLIAIAISKAHPMMENTSIPLKAIWIAFGFSGSVGVIFGMFPAAKAARLNPIEALRHE